MARRACQALRWKGVPTRSSGTPKRWRCPAKYSASSCAACASTALSPGCTGPPRGLDLGPVRAALHAALAHEHLRAGTGPHFTRRGHWPTSAQSGGGEPPGAAHRAQAMGRGGQAIFNSIQCRAQMAYRAIHVVPLLQAEQADAETLELGPLVALQRHARGVCRPTAANLLAFWMPGSVV